MRLNTAENIHRCYSFKFGFNSVDISKYTLMCSTNDQLKL